MGSPHVPVPLVFLMFFPGFFLTHSSTPKVRNNGSPYLMMDKGKMISIVIKLVVSVDYSSSNEYSPLLPRTSILSPSRVATTIRHELIGNTRKVLTKIPSDITTP